MIRGFQVRGHLIAKLDPLEIANGRRGDVTSKVFHLF